MRELLIGIIPDKSDLLLYMGMGSLFYGIYQMHIPAAFITIGILIIVIAALPFFAPIAKAE